MGLQDLAWLVAFGDTLILGFLLVMIWGWHQEMRRLEERIKWLLKGGRDD